VVDDGSVLRAEALGRGRRAPPRVDRRARCRRRSQGWRLQAGALFAIAQTSLYVPQFSWGVIVELVVPPAITLLVVRNSEK